MAIDVDEIIRYVLYRQGQRTTGPYPQQTEYYDPDVKPLPYDPAGAERLLNEAGWRKNAQGILEKDGKPLAFTLITSAGNEERQAIMVIAQNAWRRLGVKVEILTLEWAVFIRERVNKLDFDAVVLGWAMDSTRTSSRSSTRARPVPSSSTSSATRTLGRTSSWCGSGGSTTRPARPPWPGSSTGSSPGPAVHVPLRAPGAVAPGREDRPHGAAADGTSQYLPFEPNRLGRINFHFDQWIKTPRPVLPPFRPELAAG